MTNITEAEALSRVAAYCSLAEHCRSEISEKLQRWGLPYDAVNRILTHLEVEKYIDEERFCRAFVNDKYRFAKWGKVKIAQALQLKKIPYNVCRHFLNEIDDEEYLSILTGLLNTKRKSIHAENEYELNVKLIRFALSRGFEMKDIRQCVQLSDEKDFFD
ncbi:regulatory protein RecX [Bacteroides sp. UBA939]|uniref:regulatory protein RecX n=1 Tax=Bacteroides sp. UBA939 TaxID=1946092 RepID=UPI0025BAADF0|nr:regulatory protein RecX [Bacteroides sp. UBA939]